MKLESTLICLLAGWFLTACADSGYEKTDKGIIVEVKQQQSTDVRKVRLEVMGEKLIHVSATPEKNFSKEKSLIVIPQENEVDFNVEDHNDAVTVKTSQLSATVSKVTGEVCFTDADGSQILEEDRLGRSFTPIEVDGTKAYTVRQVFQSADDEAFYGLGQHQADEFNYKGKNEELFQYNTKVSVPFIVSNKNYGLLWDSYSLCRFGDPRDYSQLGSVFKLYDKEGKEGALTGTYIPSSQSDAETVVRREDSLYFEHLDRETHLNNVVNLPEDFPLMGSQVTYEGEIEPSESGIFRFILYYAGYMKVYINDELVVPERWRTAWNPNSYKFAVNLEAGKRVPLKIEWIPDGYVSYCGLRVLSPVPAEEQNKLAWWGEMQNEIDYYFIYGDNMDEVISGYRTLTGKSPIMPKWAMGYWQSRERYKTQDEVLDALKEFRRRQIPIDNIVLDWSYWPQDAWGSHEFDKARFPDPKAMVDSIHAMNAQIMISVWPKFYASTEHYKEFDQNGWMYQQAVKDSIRDWIGLGYIGSFYDAYAEGARKLFWKQMEEHLYSLGIDAWWMDASEPNIRDCTDIEYRKDLCGPTALGPSAQYFNAYALMNAEAIYDGQRSVDNDKRVFLLTRSGFAGLQRYSTATWSGDIATRWEDMKAQISAGLNFAVSGIPYWTMDIGGFCVEKRYEDGQREFNETGRENADYREWRELNTRWYQFGAFCPLYRAHGQYPYREVWNIAPEGHPCYNSIVYYTKLRYRLMPYIYSLAGMTYFNDYTIMRPLVMDFTADVNVNNIGDQFMFGPAIMVAPVYEYGARSREMYFPAGNGWYDFYSGKYIDGRQRLTVDAPYERIPLYIREGAIIPYGPDMQYNNEKPASEITLYVYGGKDGSFTLYEDEGVNYNYEEGAYATISFIYNDAEGVLTIGDRTGEFPGMLKERSFNIVKVDKNRSQPFDLDVKGIVVKYDGKQRTVKL
ncbi:TIM-barrel domain-containing protein [Bacteroides cutis]|jgi:alpha-D-xyloside xylohydrolase|uniref:TIM-barrel domain-containing protein n=1 Tax=Bacteroides cutis TaxID=2024197 RepID=UPI0023A8197F|nr:TIM-barrel domain-containing protein [Bacteroides cutis]